MTEKLILMHENTPYFNFFPFFDTLRGAVAPRPPVAPPLYGMDYSPEILANLKKKHILDDFRGIWVSYRKEGPTWKLPDIIK